MSLEVIGLVVLMYVHFPLSLRNVENLLFECRYDICHVTVDVVEKVRAGVCRRGCGGDKAGHRNAGAVLSVAE